MKKDPIPFPDKALLFSDTNEYNRLYAQWRAEQEKDLDKDLGQELFNKYFGAGQPRDDERLKYVLCNVWWTGKED